MTLAAQPVRQPLGFIPTTPHLVDNSVTATAWRWPLSIAATKLLRSLSNGSNLAYTANHLAISSFSFFILLHKRTRLCPRRCIKSLTCTILACTSRPQCRQLMPSTNNTRCLLRRAFPPICRYTSTLSSQACQTHPRIPTCQGTLPMPLWTLTTKMTKRVLARGGESSAHAT